MDINKLINKLHPLERKVLPVLDKLKNLNEIIAKTGLKQVEVMRALQWLSNKDILKINEELKEVVELGDNGKEYLEKELPEKRFLEIIKKETKSEEEIRNKLSPQEFGVCMGILRKN